MTTPPNHSTPSRLRADEITVEYDRRAVIERLHLDVVPGSFTMIIGPNACGKSTLLRSLSGLLSPATGAVILDGKTITAYRAKDAARRLGLLPQSAVAPDGITVAELVARGRYAHQTALRQWSRDDADAVATAMSQTRVDDLAQRRVDELSGGQRQRVWIAMVLAQQTPLILLDEPTTFLDVAHQIEVLDLLHELHVAGRTVVAVLHDLNHAARYATHLITMKDGCIVAQGDPRTTLDAELVERVFGLPNTVIDDPVTGAPLVIPLDSRAVRRP